MSPTTNPTSIDLNAPCSRHLRWRDLIECGETWARLASTPQACTNLPQHPETWLGLQHLAQAILDPLIDHFGRLDLTYCFAGAALTRHIRSRIAPALDQHAGSERNRAGQPICPRLGQACDVRVPGLPAGELATFIATHLPFDRLYLYEPDRPLHVSVGPENRRVAYQMVLLPRGGRVPRRWAASGGR